VSVVRIVDGESRAGARGFALAALPKDLDFFAEDAEKLQEAPEYSAAALAKHAELRDRAFSELDFCAPKCAWACAAKECDQVCQPHCAPPQCRTICTRSVDLCETRCGPPQCAVVCPPECPNGGPHCGRCRTVCSPPVCTDQCGTDCQNFCEKPRCTWNCTVGECPKPDCSLQCSGFTRCSKAYRPIDPTVPPQYPDADPATLVGRAEAPASLDPSTLSLPATRPPPWELRPREEENSTAPANNSMNPVRALKLKWKAEDRGAKRIRSDEARSSVFDLPGLAA